MASAFTLCPTFTISVELPRHPASGSSLGGHPELHATSCSWFLLRYSGAASLWWCVPACVRVRVPRRVCVGVGVDTVGWWGGVGPGARV